MRSSIRLLRESPEFTKLWLAQVVSLIGDWFNTIVLSALVVAYTDGSGLALGFFLLSRFLPPLVVTPLAGVLVDRWDRKKLLLWSNLLRAVIVPFFLLAGSPDQLWIIYFITITQFTLSAIFEPGQAAIIPSLIKPGDLVRANTLVSITWSVMLAFGAIFGGVFATTFGNSAAILFDALTFAVAGGLIAAIRYIPEQRPLDFVHNHSDTSFRQGLKYIRHHRDVSMAIFVKIGTHLGNVDTLMTIFATQLFVLGNGGELSLGILYSIFGVGAFLGPVLANRFNDGTVPRMRRLIIWGFVGIALGWFIMGGANSLWIVGIGLFMRAIGGSINWTYSTIIIQKTSANAYLGRMFSLDMAGFQLATVLSTLIHGGLIDLGGAQSAMLIALGTGIVSIIPLLIWYWLIPRVEQREAMANTLQA